MAYWLLPVFIIVYAVLGNPNSPEFVWWAFIAAVSCGFPLISAGYNPLSFVSIWAFLHAIYYPVAVLLNLMASHPGVYERYLWENTHLAMAAVSVGMTGFALGSSLVHAKDFVPKASNKNGCFESKILEVSPNKLAFLVFLIIPLAIFQWSTGTYYQYFASGPEGFSFKSAMTFGYIGYIEYVICAAVFLQFRRYFISRSRRDLIYSAIFFLLPILVYLLSGSRDRTFRVSIYAFILSIAGFQKRFPKKIIYIGISVLSVLFIMIAINTYRGTIYYKFGSPELSIKERISLLVEAIDNTKLELQENFDHSLRRWGRRFADYVVVGRIVSIFPSMFKYRYLEGMKYWPIYLLPNPIRPEVADFNPQDSAVLSESVMGSSRIGSSPSMIIGDLYSRFSWPGIFFGMALIGFLFRCLDKHLVSFGRDQTLFYGLLLIPILKAPQGSFFELFTIFSRNLVISLVLFLMLRWFLSKKIKF
jgi:hypothetical protein